MTTDDAPPERDPEEPTAPSSELARKVLADPRLKTYLDALLELNTSINLTAVREPEAAWRAHALDSAALLELDFSKPPRRAVDIGSGNGFPGIVVALAFPDCEVWLSERRRKKARAIGELAAKAGITNVRLFDRDVRELPHAEKALAGGADLVTARAVARLDKLIELAAPLLSKRGRLICWKSRPLADDELAEGRRAAKKVRLWIESTPYEVEALRPAQLLRVARK